MDFPTVDQILDGRLEELKEWATTFNIQVQGTTKRNYTRALLGHLDGRTSQMGNAQNSSSASEDDATSSSTLYDTSIPLPTHDDALSRLQAQITDLSSQISNLVANSNGSRGDTLSTAKMKCELLAKKLVVMPHKLIYEAPIGTIQTVKRIQISLEKAVIFFMLDKNISENDFAIIFTSLFSLLIELLIITSFPHLSDMLKNLSGAIDQKSRTLTIDWFKRMSSLSFEDDAKIDEIALINVLPKAVTDTSKDLNIRITPKDLMNRKFTKRDRPSESDSSETPSSSGNASRGKGRRGR